MVVFGSFLVPPLGGQVSTYRECTLVSTRVAGEISWKFLALFDASGPGLFFGCRQRLQEDSLEVGVEVGEPKGIAAVAKRKQVCFSGGAPDGFWGG